MYVEAAKLTLIIGLIGTVLAAAVGLLCALAKYFRIPVARQIASVYIELSRNTPLIVQLFFLYFGLPKVGVRLSSEACGGLRRCGAGLSRRQLYGGKHFKRLEIR